MTSQARERLIWLRRWRRSESSALLATAMLALFVLAPSFSACMAAAPLAASSLHASTLSASSLTSSAAISDAALSEAVLQWLEASLATSGESSSSCFATGIETPGVAEEAGVLRTLHLTPYHIAHAIPPTSITPQKSTSRRAMEYSLPQHEAAARSGIRTNSFPE